MDAARSKDGVCILYGLNIVQHRLRHDVEPMRESGRATLLRESAFTFATLWEEILRASERRLCVCVCVCVCGVHTKAHTRGAGKKSV